MKNLKIVSIVSLIVILSCNKAVQNETQKVNFGIYETDLNYELNDSLIKKLKESNCEIEVNPTSPIVIYAKNNENFDFVYQENQENIKLLKTVYSVDNNKEYYAIVAVKGNQVISNVDIKKAKNSDKNVEIHLNLKGARKWAEVTKDNVGKLIAITIDNKIHALVQVQAEIKNGLVLLTGLENEKDAKALSKSLNFSSKKN